eukprot:793142_1
MACLLKGTKVDCVRLASRLSERGFVTAVIPQQPEDGYLRNRLIEQTSPSQPWQSGHASLVLVSELVNLIRTLGMNYEWEPLVNEIITESLSKLPSISETLNRSGDIRSQLKTAEQPLACLAVLGGFTEMVSAGGRVMILDDSINSAATRSSNVFGTVIEYERGWKEARVIFDTDFPRVATPVPITRLRAVSPINMSTIDASFVFKPEILRSIADFVHSFHEISLSVDKSPEKRGISGATGIFRRQSRAEIKENQSENTNSVDAVSAHCVWLKSELLMSCLQSLSTLLEQKSRCELISSNEFSGLVEVLVKLAEKCDPSANIYDLKERSTRLFERALDLLNPPSLPIGQTTTAEDEPSENKAVRDSDPAAILPHFRYAAYAQSQSPGDTAPPPPGSGEAATSTPPMPTHWSARSVRSVMFEGADKRTVRFCQAARRVNRGDLSESIFVPGRGGSRVRPGRRIGGSTRAQPRRVVDPLEEYIILADQPVLQSLPEFYFEITFTSIPLNANVSIGLTPKPPAQSREIQEFSNFAVSMGMSLSRMNNLMKPIGRTWAPRSLRFSNTGKVFRGTSGGSKQDLADLFNETHKFASGDTIGCGWNLSDKDGPVYFTKNGKVLLETAAALGVPYIPAVGSSKGGTVVHVNFGQDEFQYVLPVRNPNDDTEEDKTERRKRAEMVAHAQKKEEEEEKERLNVAEVAKQAARMEAAQTILMVCGDLLQHDIRRAMKALEMSGENPNQAVTWLMDHSVEAVHEIDQQIKDEDDASKDEQSGSSDVSRPGSGKRQKSMGSAKSLSGRDSGKRKSSLLASLCIDPISLTSSEPGARDTATVTPLSQLPPYDWQYSTSVVRRAAYDSFLFPDEELAVGASASSAQQEEEWLAEVELLLRQQQVDPHQLESVMSGLRAGGDRRTTSLIMVSDLVPDVPPPPSSAEEQKVLSVKSESLAPEELRVGLRVLVGSPPSNMSSRSGSSPQPSNIPSSGKPKNASADSDMASSVWVATMHQCSGRVGTVQRVDSHAHLALVCFDRTDQSLCEQWWFPAASLRRVHKDSRDAFIGIETRDHVLSSVNRKVIDEMSCLYARRCILSMCANTSKFMEQITQPTSDKSVTHSTLLRLAGAEVLPQDLSVRASGRVSCHPSGAGSRVGVTPKFEGVLERIFEEAIRAHPDLCNQVLEQCSAMITKNSSAVSSKDAFHKKEPQRFLVKGASALILSVGRKTKLPKSGVSVNLYADFARTKILKRVSGAHVRPCGPRGPSSIRVCALPTNEVWAELVADPGTVIDPDKISFNVEVCPLPSELNLALWMVDTLTDKVSESSSELGGGSICEILKTSLEALSQFLSTPKLPTLVRRSIFFVLGRGLRVLSGVSGPLTSGPAVFQAAELFSETLHLKTNEVDLAPHTLYFQALVELMVTYRHVFGEEAYTQYAKQAMGTVKSRASKRPARGNKKRRSEKKEESKDPRDADSAASPPPSCLNSLAESPMFSFMNAIQSPFQPAASVNFPPLIESLSAAAAGPGPPGGDNGGSSMNGSIFRSRDSVGSVSSGGLGGGPAMSAAGYGGVGGGDPSLVAFGDGLSMHGYHDVPFRFDEGVGQVPMDDSNLDAEADSDEMAMVSIEAHGSSVAGLSESVAGLSESGPDLASIGLPPPAIEDMAICPADEMDEDSLEASVDLLASMGFDPAESRIALMTTVSNATSTVTSTAASSLFGGTQSNAPRFLKRPSSSKSSGYKSPHPSLRWFDDLCTVCGVLQAFSTSSPLPQGFASAALDMWPVGEPVGGSEPSNVDSESKSNSRIMQVELAEAEHLSWTFAIDVDVARLMALVEEHKSRNGIGTSANRKRPYSRRGSRSSQGSALSCLSPLSGADSGILDTLRLKFASLADLDLGTIRRRMAMHAMLNFLLENALCLVDLTQSDNNPWSIAAQLA